MKYLFKKSQIHRDGSVVIPPALAERWKRQLRTRYSDLPEKEKESDLIEADRVLAAIQKTRGATMNLSNAMNTQIAIDDESYALAMIPMMPGPVRRYVERLIQERDEAQRGLVAKHVSIIEALRRYRTAMILGMQDEASTHDAQEWEDSENDLFYLLDELDNEEENDNDQE